MKITQISTSDNGGAGIAALRLHNGLLQENFNSNFLSLWQHSNSIAKQKILFDGNIKLNYFNRALRKLGFPVTQEDKNRHMLKRRNGNYEIFSFPFTDYRVEQHSLVLQSDIINLHWIAGFLNYPTFFNIHKPIVWTLHDMNPFMGGFHYLGDKERNQHVLGNLEQQLLQTKQQILANRKARTTIVTPSKWLSNLAKQSAVLQKFEMRVIPNSIDTNVFKPSNQEFSRSAFNLDTDKQIILFVSDNIHNYRKGFDLLINALKQLNLKDDFLLVTVGQMPSDIPALNNTINLGKINDERLMALLYSAADVFILPSREDNLPNVMLEAVACGTPIIAFNTGGIPETISSGFNGILAEQVTTEDLCNAIMQFVNKDYVFNRSKIRQHAEEHFALSVQANRYADLYKELMEN